MVSLKSRSIEAGLAVSRSRAAEKWLRGRGASHVLFKICSTFDSTDAGNIGPVMDALRADSGEAIVLVTPAFPETGRTVYQGNLFVGAVPLNESPLKDHPLNPMHDSNLVRVLARQSKTQGRSRRPRDTVTRGAEAVRARLAELVRQGHRRRDHRRRVRPRPRDHRPRRRRARLSVGASGIGLGLARALVSTGKVKSAAASGEAGRSRRRTGGLPRRKLLAGDAAADRQRRTRHAGAASRPRPYYHGSGRSAARAGLGEASVWPTVRS